VTRAASAAGQIVGAAGRTAAAVVARVRPAGPHDPIEMLERDHRRLEELFERGEKMTERAVRGRRSLLQMLKAELQTHELIEEKVLYPALKPRRDARDVVLEGYQEHHVADVLVRELERLAPDDERWGAKFKVLKENIEHHIEEEEGEMFPTARALLSRDELDLIGRRMEALKSRRQR
jgi:hemerythrin-like domain-containing protein